MTTSEPAPASWRLHDYLVGILGGGGLGAVLGVYAAARVFEGNVAIAVAAIIGALVGVLLMLQTRRNNEGFWTVTVAVMWIIAIASAAFLIMLYRAILNFN